jgi:hypothetical protein
VRLLTEIETIKRNPAASTPKSVEEICRELDVSDAARYQRSAAMNSEAYRRNGNNSATLTLATIQYAYARWLLGIDDYYLSLPYHLPHRQHRQGHGWYTPRAGGKWPERTPTPWHSGPARIPPR